MAASACARACDISWKDIQIGIKAVTNIPGRLEKLSTDKGVDIFVDYAHTDDALRNVLTTLSNLKKSLNKRAIITIFGCGGDRDRSKRPRMGRAVLEQSNLSIITSDNPRTEDARAIINDIIDAKELKEQLATPDQVTKQSYLEKKQCITIVDRRQAIRFALDTAQPGDIVLLAGKGHEDYQEINRKRYPFDDRQVVKELTKELGCNIVSA